MHAARRRASCAHNNQLRWPGSTACQLLLLIPDRSILVLLLLVCALLFSAFPTDVDATRECPIGTGTGPYSISRADVAAVCVEALARPSAANKHLSVFKQRHWSVAQPLPVGLVLEDELQRVFKSVGLYERGPVVQLVV